MAAVGANFGQLDWRSDDALVLNGLLFRIQQTLPPGKQEPSTDHFRLYKDRSMVDDYLRFFSDRPDFDARRVVELGIWDGGSIAMWNELLQPDALIGLDLSTRGDSPYFSDYIASRSLGERVHTYWGVDQSDSARLLDLLASHGCGELDLVVDDASHWYGPTRSSFETLFPLLCPGGYYVIEDWGWTHYPEFLAPDALWRDQRGLVDFITDVLAVMASTPTAIARAAVFRQFAAFERGELGLQSGTDIETLICRRQQYGLPRRAYIGGRRRLHPVRRILQKLARRD